MIRIGFDLDGVLCDFNTAFLRVLQEIAGRPVGPCGDLRLGTNRQRYTPDTWRWYRDALDVTPVEVRQAWAHVEAPSTRFWERLEPIHTPNQTRDLVGALLRSKTAEVYFLTSRVGSTARRQSEAWLLAYGAPARPTVLVTDEKGLMAKALRLDAVIDDHVRHAHEVRAYAPHCQMVLVDTPANRRPVLTGVEGVVGYQGLVDFLRRYDAIR